MREGESNGAYFRESLASSLQKLETLIPFFQNERWQVCGKKLDLC